MEYLKTEMITNKHFKTKIDMHYELSSMSSIEYARKVRERKLLWRKQKIIENDKKEAWKKELLREQAEKAEEEEKQRTQRTREEAASASSAPAAQEEKNYDKENPPRPTREVPLPTYERVPHTPGPETTAKSRELQERARKDR
eukprot:2961216-Amphidinium_carterae.1